VQYWQRPGKDGTAWSATLGACGPYFYVFSSNASPFQPEHAYSPFSAYGLLDHSGDFQTAARTLIPQRFAAEWPSVSSVVGSLLDQLLAGGEARMVFDALPTLKILSREAWDATKHAIKGLLGDAIDLVTLQAAWRKSDQPSDMDGADEEGDPAESPGDRQEDLPYRATRRGLVWRKETKDGPVSVLLANFTATITADVALDDGAEVQHRFEIEARHRGAVTRFTVPASQFAGLTWVTEHLGAQAILMPGVTLKDHTRAAVQLLSREVAPHRIYTHLGWRNLGEAWVYLHAGGAIGQDGQVTDAVEVCVSDDLQRYVLEAPASPAALVQAVRASMRLLEVAPLPLTLPLYASLWRAVLGRLP
jgi:hypothetical protein